MQTFQDTEVYRPENIISAMLYDNKRRWLVTGNMKLKVHCLRRSAFVSKLSVSRQHLALHREPTSLADVLML